MGRSGRCGGSGERGAERGCARSPPWGRDPGGAAFGPGTVERLCPVGPDGARCRPAPLLPRPPAGGGGEGARCSLPGPGGSGARPAAGARRGQGPGRPGVLRSFERCPPPNGPLLGPAAAALLPLHALPTPPPSTEPLSVLFWGFFSLDVPLLLGSSSPRLLSSPVPRQPRLSRSTRRREEVKPQPLPC